MPNWKWPDEIIDINDTNAKVKIGNKIKALKVNKLKFFLKDTSSETDTYLQDLNINENQNDVPITRARAKLINYKNAVHWHY